MTSLILAMLLLAGPAYAGGRKPAPKDSYPDYNKLEYKRRIPTEEEINATNAAAAAGMPTPSSRPVTVPSLNVPDDAQKITDETPMAPPKAVPLPDDFSEPPLPDSMRDTLVPGATVQQ